MKKRSAFKTFYLLYVLILVVLLLFVFFYTRKTMIQYENSGSENYVLQLVKDAKKGSSDLAKYMEENCFSKTSLSGKIGDPAARKARFQAVSQNAELSVAPASGAHDSSHPVYNVFADGEPFLTVALSEGESTTKLGIMTISTWNVESCVLRAEGAETTNVPLDSNGTLTYHVSVPTDFTLLIDGVPVGDAAEVTMTEIEDFQYVAPFTDVPEMENRTLDGLSFEPVFTVKNNAGKPVEVTNRNGNVTCAVAYESTSEAEKLGSSVVNPLLIGETWSKFMTNDVGGEAHGLYTVRNTCLLVPGSDLYQKATSWASNVDITFVSGHTITSWTGERVTNYVLYSEDFFSCDVYFEKNMTLKTGAQRTDVFNNRMFFINNKNEANGPLGWRLVDMFAL